MTRYAYYNEIDEGAVSWLRELISKGHIARGEIDTRSIRDVSPDDLKGFTQCHFFAGIGVWSYALRRAGWSDDRPVWTGSCPCQPFSAAGKGEGLDDPRHLWPDWFRLIRERGPVVVFGEQVAGPDGVAWLDLAQADLEEHSHTVGAVVTCSAGFGGPDIRQRIYWVANADEGQRRSRRLDAGSAHRPHAQPTGRGAAGRLADAHGERLEGLGLQLLERGSRAAVPETTGRGEADGVGDTLGAGLEEHRGHGNDGDEPGRLGAVAAGSVAAASFPGGMADAGHAERRPRDRTCDEGGQHLLRQEREEGPVEPRERGEDGRPGPLNGFWRAADWLLCTDGKWRPVEPGTFPLDTGTPGRVGRLRAYGNALNAEAAKEFIGAYMNNAPSQFRVFNKERT